MHTTGSNREIRRLPTVLHDGETVHALATCRHDDGPGLLAVTDQRLLFLHSGLLSQRLASFAYPDITSAEWYAGTAEGVLVLHAPPAHTEFRALHNDDGQTVANALHRWTPAH